MITSLEINDRNLQAEAGFTLDYVSNATGIRADKKYKFYLRMQHEEFERVSHFDHFQAFVKQSAAIRLYGLHSDPESLNLLQEAVATDDFADSLKDNFTWRISSFAEVK